MVESGREADVVHEDEVTVASCLVEEGVLLRDLEKRQRAYNTGDAARCPTGRRVMFCWLDTGCCRSDFTTRPK